MVNSLNTLLGRRVVACAFVLGLTMITPLTWAGTYYRTISIDGAQLASPLTDFPLLISVAGPELASVGNGGHVSQIDGSDIHFTSLDGATVYSHEIEGYSPVTGSLRVWVRVPALFPASLNQFILRYGGTVPVVPAPESTWDTGHLMVQHFEEATGNAFDSTSNHYDGIPEGGPSQSGSGMVDRCFGFDGADDRVAVSGGNLGVASVTVEAWVKYNDFATPCFNGLGQGGPIFATRTIESEASPTLLVTNISGGAGTQLGVAFLSDASGTALGAKGNSTLNASVWYHVVGTFSYSGAGAHKGSWNIYLNGVPNNTGVNNFTYAGTAALPFTGVTWTIGDHQAWTNAESNIQIDEMRVSNVARSAAWINASYRNQAGTAGFVIIDAESLDVAPNTSDIAPATTGPTSADNMAFAVTFDEPVQNFNDVADLTLAHSGTAGTGASITGGPAMYTVTVTGLSGDGSFTLAVNTASDVQDLAGNALASSVTSAAVIIDNTAPQFTPIMATPPKATLGQSVSVTVTASQALAAEPVVTVNGHATTYTGNSSLDYFYLYTVLGTDPDGPASVSVSGTDVAGNPGASVNPAAFVVDSTGPQFMSIAATPPLATLGQAVSITFTASEALGANPLVTVNGHAAFHANNVGLDYSYLYTVLGSDPDGPAAIAVSGVDLVGNAGASSGGTALTIDQSAPSFSSVLANPSEAAAGAVVVIGFDSSEPIAGDPDVTVNGNPATRTAKASFTYEYTVLASDPIGPATLTVGGVDAAGNAGMLTNNDALSITEPLSGLPVAAWPLGLALAAVATRTLRRRPLG